jgi:DNA-directed RNA polymerase specialized sigma24 family protein
MLGSVGDADDAVQEGWLRASRADTSDVGDVRAWLTTVVARVSLNMLRSRRSKREEEPLGVHDWISSSAGAVKRPVGRLLPHQKGEPVVVRLSSLDRRASPTTPAAHSSAVWRRGRCFGR